VEAVSNLTVERPAGGGLLVGGFLLFGVEEELLGKVARVLSFSNLDGRVVLKCSLVLLQAIYSNA
jgi:hypothetical protein